MKTKTLLLLAFISLFQNLLFSQEKGKIIYTDFEPDTVIQGYALNTYVPPKHPSTENQIDSLLHFDVDINYDSLWDFGFYAEHDSKNFLWVDIDLNTNWKYKLCNTTDPEDLSQLDYTYSGGPRHIYSIYLGDEPTVEEKKIALRYFTPEGFCYGWLSISVTSGPPVPHEVYLTTITIYEMAYCTIPNYPLKFGQKDFVDIEENIYEMSDVNLFPNPVGDKLSLQLPLNTHCNEVKIYNIAGILLKTQNNNFDNIDLSYLSQGVYIVKINLNDGYICTKKIVKK
jgi:hypothetical protein